ncbi:Polyamine deacetylase HDAC10 [Schistosoma japonicum]|nr:Polyamine deacetylase HDAC10 [Schistosoma japonicum]
MSVLYISIHRYEKGEFWPNLREANYDFIGTGPSKEKSSALFVLIGMTDSDYLAIFHQLIMPIATEFNPQLILVSCGFDAAIGCPEGRMWLTPMIFGHFIHKLKSLAEGKVVVVLEHTIQSCINVLRPYWKSLPSVKMVTWPETNPQLPRVLTNHIQQLLVNYFPSPLSIANEYGQQMTLILMPTSELSMLPNCQDRRKHGRRRRRKEWKYPLNSLLSTFNDQFHVHVYNKYAFSSNCYHSDLQYDWLLNKCNCSNYVVIKSKYQSIDYVIKDKQEMILNFSNALHDALCLMLMGKFQKLYLVNRKFSLINLIDTITSISMEFLISYRERIFKPRNFQMNTEHNKNIVEVMSKSSFLPNSVNEYKQLNQLKNVYNYSNQSNIPSSMLLSSTSSMLSTSSLFDCRSRIVS